MKHISIIITTFLKLVCFAVYTQDATSFFHVVTLQFTALHSTVQLGTSVPAAVLDLFCLLDVGLLIFLTKSSKLHSLLVFCQSANTFPPFFIASTWVWSIHPFGCLQNFITVLDFSFHFG